jgi:hypothetical protein
VPNCDEAREAAARAITRFAFRRCADRR